MSSDLHRLSACAVVDRLVSGDLAPREVVEAIAARIEAVDGAVNALPTRCFDRAMAAARALEHRPRHDWGPLAGLPVPIKDSYAVAGVRTTWGSLAFADHVPGHSDHLVEAIEASGGVVYAKSNTPEFEAGANTFNAVFGATLNPWNRAMSAGGSSGGAAVAVATGMAFFAQGSDFACSVRYPAAFCGITGLRPTPGLVPQGPSALPTQTLSVIGPLARTVADVGLALDAMARFDPRDPLSHPATGVSFRAAAEAPRKAARLRFSLDFGFATVSRAVRDALATARGRLEAAGLALDDIALDLSPADQAFRVLRAFQFAAVRREVLATHRDMLKPDVVWNIEEGLKLRATDIAAAEALRAEARRRLVDALAHHEAIIAPTTPVGPFPVGERFVGAIDDVPQDTYLDWLALGYAITVTGCPAISIPCGFTVDGLPVGLQIIGRPHGEADLLRLAAWCEGALGSALAAPIDPRP